MPYQEQMSSRGKSYEHHRAMVERQRAERTADKLVEARKEPWNPSGL